MSTELFLDNPAQTFFQRLRERRMATSTSQANSCSPVVPDMRQWLQYWNDEESLAGNLRNVEHWLQRAHMKA